MCLAIYKPKGIKIERSHYENGFKKNDHGGGFCYVGPDKNGKMGIIVKKGFSQLEEMLDAMKDIEEKHAMLIHFRKASVGGTSLDLCHPFAFTSKDFPQYDFAVIHNGTLAYGGTTKKSDTACFVDEILDPHLSRDPYFLDSATGRWMMEEIISYNNKLLVMRFNREDNKTSVYILNEGQGHKVKGCWYSNTSYLPPVIPVVHTPSAGIGYAGDWPGIYGGSRGSVPTSNATSNLKPWEKPGALEVWYLNDKGVYTKREVPIVTNVGKGGSIIHMVIAKMAKLCDKAKTDGPLKVGAGVSINQALQLLDARMEAKAKEIEDHNKVVSFPSEDAAWDKAQGEHDEAELGIGAVDQAAIDYINAGNKPKVIEVPRDADAKKEPEAKKEATPVRGTGFDHLTKRQRVKMRKLCMDYLKAQNVQDYQKMGLYEQLVWMRDDVRDGADWLNDMSDKQLDYFMLYQVSEMEKAFIAEKQAKKAEAAEKAALEKQEQLRLRNEVKEGVTQ